MALRLGAADPPFHGAALWVDPALTWAGGPSWELEPGQGVWHAAPDEAAPPEGPFTLKARATLSAAGDPSAAWGVWLAQADGTRVLWAISGEQLVTTRICPAEPPPAAVEDCPAARPEWRWMPFHLIRPPGRVNTIALRRDAAGAVRLWLNGERMGMMPVEPGGAWGVWARGGRDGAAGIAWEQVGLYDGH